MTRECTQCGSEIPAERLEVLPNTDTCINCSNVGTVLGFMVPTAAKGCASQLHFVSTDDSEGVRQATNANKRRR
jgi:hypothetical protein